MPKKAKSGYFLGHDDDVSPPLSPNEDDPVHVGNGLDHSLCEFENNIDYVYLNRDSDYIYQAEHGVTCLYGDFHWYISQNIPYGVPGTNFLQYSLTKWYRGSSFDSL